MDANGNLYDGICTDKSYLGPWTARVKRSGAGYAVTFALPFKTFGIETELRGRFGIQAMRTIDHGGEQSELRRSTARAYTVRRDSSRST